MKISPSADLVILGGKIYQPAFQGARALAILDGRIMALGAEKDVASWIQQGQTKIIDLKGGSILPGLIDSHCHFCAFLRSRCRLNFHPKNSKGEIIQQVREKAEYLPANRWIFGRGWNRTNWVDASFPTAKELDDASPRHPVALSSRDGHAGWLNSLALKALGITSSTSDPPGGQILRDSRGHPLGVITENALLPMEKKMAEQSLSLEEGRAGLDELYAMGLTSFFTLEGKGELLFLQNLKRAGILKGTIGFSIPQSSLDWAINLGLQTGFGGDFIFGGVKLFADGALGSQTAYMKEPYGEGNTLGILVTPPDELAQIFQKALSGGIAVMVHAIGDGAVELVVSTLEEKSPATPPWLFSRIEHCQHIAPEVQRRMGKLNVIASMQPCHLFGDWESIHRLLPDQQEQAYPFASLLRRGVPLAFGSDTPIESPHPFRGMYSACKRDDFLAGQESISREQALWAYTTGAGQSFGAQGLGVIQRGAPADLIALRDDFSTIPLEEFPGLRPIFTMIKGQVVAGEKNGGL